MGASGVLDGPQGLPEAPLVIKFLQAGQLKSGDVLGGSGHPHQHLVLTGPAALWEMSLRIWDPRPNVFRLTL